MQRASAFFGQREFHRAPGEGLELLQLAVRHLVVGGDGEGAPGAK